MYYKKQIILEQQKQKILKENRIDLYSEKMDKISSFKDSYIYNMDKYIEVYSKNLTRYFDFVGKELNNKDIFSQTICYFQVKKMINGDLQI